MIRINSKEGIWYKFIDYRFLHMARVVFRVYQKQDVIPTVTSAADGVHGPGSYHPDGLGWDFRVWGLSGLQAVADEIREELKTIDFHYDVVYGDSKHLDHIHIEFDERKVS